MGSGMGVGDPVSHYAIIRGMDYLASAATKEGYRGYF